MTLNQEGPYAGLAIAKAIAQIHYRSDESFQKRFGRSLVEKDRSLAYGIAFKSNPIWIITEKSWFAVSTPIHISFLIGPWIPMTSPEANFHGRSRQKNLRNCRDSQHQH